MTPFTLYSGFLFELGSGEHKLATDQLKVALTNENPKGARRIEDIRQIHSENGYIFGGIGVESEFVEREGSVTLTLSDPVFVAQGGSFGPWQWAVIYNINGGRLIGWADFGKRLLCDDGDEFQVRIGELLEFVQQKG